MADKSQRPIGDINVGDQVMSADPKDPKGGSKLETVTELHRNTDYALTKLTIKDRDGKKSVLNTTQNHPFWDATDHKWADARNLKRGHHLKVWDNGDATVAQVVNTNRKREMRDLTISKLHTYYVLAGNTPVLVHNCGDALQGFASTQREVPGTKFASEYTSPSGAKYYSTNRHGTAGEIENMPELRDAVDAAGHHGGCAEVGCLIQAYRAEGPSAISGGTMRTVNVRNPMSSRAAEQGTPAAPCARCGRLLGSLGIGGS